VVAVNGTWKVTGYGAAPVLMVAAAAAAVEGVEWVLAWLWLIALLALAVTVATMLAVAWLMRWTQRQDAARVPLWRGVAAPAEIRAEPVSELPRTDRPAIAPVINLNFYGADGTDMAARVLRTAIPGTAGDAITEGERS
jgi:hypothetical protein